MSGYAIANPTYGEFLHSLGAWERWLVNPGIELLLQHQHIMA
jgi:hypothetical protein